MPSTKQEHLLWKERKQEFYNMEVMWQNEAFRYHGVANQMVSETLLKPNST